MMLGLVLLAVLVMAILGTAIFVGMGALLAQWMPVSLFQAALLAIGATVAVALVVHVGTTMVQHQMQHAWYDEDNEWEPNEELDIAPQPPKIGRNAPCPCNSGKKYKNCCGAPSTT